MNDQFSEASKIYDEAANMSGNLKNRMTEQAEIAKSKLGEFSRKVGEKLDDQRTRAASTLEGSATSLHETAESLPGGVKVRNIAHNTADKLHATATYIRDHDASAFVEDMRNVVRRYPAQTLAAGLIFGFVLGRALSRRSD